MIQPKGSILELCQVVRDMDRALEHWVNVMGAGPFYTFDIPPLPGQKYRGQPTDVALRIAFGFSGGLLIELLQQLNEAPSVFQEMLDTHGEGYHHVLLRMPFDEGAARFAARGYEMAFSGTMPSGDRFAIFDSRKDNGGYIELMDMSPPMWEPIEAIHRAHVGWDGKTDPKRDFFSLVNPAAFGS